MMLLCWKESVMLRDTQRVPHGDREGKGSQRMQCEKRLCVTWILHTNDTNMATARLMQAGAVVCWLLSSGGCSSASQALGPLQSLQEQHRWFQQCQFTSSWN